MDAPDLTYVGVTFTVALNGVTSAPVTLDITPLFQSGTTADKLRTDKAKLTGAAVVSYAAADVNRDAAISANRTMSPGVAMIETWENQSGSMNNTTIRAAAGGDVMFHFGTAYTGSGDICYFSNIPLTCDGTTYIVYNITGLNTGWSIYINP